MILKRARVEKYRCIDDSGEFSVNQVTCLVGKNEAGKTTLLKALQKLKSDIPEKQDFKPVDDYPRRYYSRERPRLEDEDRVKETPPVLTTIWELEDTDISYLTETFSVDFAKNHVLEDKTVTVMKGYDNQLKWDIDIDDGKLVHSYLKSYLAPEEASKLEEITTIPDLIAKLQTLESAETAPAETAPAETAPAETAPELALLELIKEKFVEGETVLETIIDALEKRLPTFLYFERCMILRGRVAIADLVDREVKHTLDDRDRVLIALLHLAGTSTVEFLQQDTFEEGIIRLEAASNSISEEIFRYWSQSDYLNVNFASGKAGEKDEIQGLILDTRIYNNRHKASINFDERSTGFIWFFSFLAWFSKLKENYGENLIILLDDPGLSLHAKAQGDLLTYINERLRPNHQVIYTTHSPFMIDPDNLLGVRTVEDVVIRKNGKIQEIQGTKVGDISQILITDPDTIFPLQAALGYDMAQTMFVGLHNLLVEGSSDLLYLQWFSAQLEKKQRQFLDPRWVIVPCGGIDKMASFVAIFGGKKLDVAIFTDFHTYHDKRLRDLKQQEKARNQKEEENMKRHRIFRNPKRILPATKYTFKDESDTEDMLGRSLYITLVNKAYCLEGPDEISINTSQDSTRVLEEVEQHFESHKLGHFSHLTPALFLMGHTEKLEKSLPNLEEALERFERLFKDLNPLLPKP